MKVSFLPILFLCLPAAVTCFSAVPMGSQVAAASLNDSTQTVADVGSWRIVLNIGREAFSTMEFGWGASGCRLPLVIEADLYNDGLIIPRDEHVRFTGPGGQVVSPIQFGTWTVSNDRNLKFSLNFPEKVQRRDVMLEAGSEIVCEGLVYPTKVVKELNERFYAAREETWAVGKELNDISRRKEASKKWNPETNQWEKRYEDEPLLNQIGKRLNLFSAQAEQRKKNAQRPNPKSLSLESGPFPGFDNHVYLPKEGGVVKIKGKGWGGDAIIGTWSAEPIMPFEK